MQIIWIILVILIALAALWCLAIRPGRRREEVLRPLRQYLYAHRGLHDRTAGIPENSLAAFRRAAELGYGAELDVRLTKDRRLAIMHDDDLMRVCGVGKKVSESDMAELAQIRFPGTEEHIPCLEEVLSLFAGRVPLILELKADQKTWPLLCRQVCEVLRDYEGAYCVESFAPQVAYWMKKHCPQVARGQLADHMNRSGRRLHPVLNLMLRNLQFNFLTKPDFVAYRVEERDRIAMRLCRRLYRVQEVSWTVRDSGTADRLMAEKAIVIFEGFLPSGEAPDDVGAQRDG